MPQAIGAMVAVVALESAVRPAGPHLPGGALGVLARLGSGLLTGTAGGLLIVALLRVHRLVPEGLENVFGLSLVLALYQASLSPKPTSTRGGAARPRP